jgi:membrane protease YdiL (CAAX protease family)
VAVAMIWFPGPLGRALFMAAKVWLVAVPVFWHLAVDRRPPSASPMRRGGVGIGMSTGFAAAGIIVCSAYLFGVFRMDMAELAGEVGEMGLADPRSYLLGAAGWTFANSLMEEIVYRWFVYTRCERLMPVPAAMIASAGVFTAHHVVALSTYLPWHLTTLASVGVFAGGLLWSWLYSRTRSIWPGWISHVLADIAVFAVGWVVLFG